MPLPPTIAVDTSIRVPCTCGATTVWPYVAGGRGLNALPHPTDPDAVVQHVDDGPCGRVRRYPPALEDVRPAAAPVASEPLTLFDLDTQETR